MNAQAIQPEQAGVLDDSELEDAMRAQTERIIGLCREARGLRLAAQINLHEVVMMQEHRDRLQAFVRKVARLEVASNYTMKELVAEARGLIE